MPSENPDPPAILSQVTGYPRDRFEYTGEIADLSEMELTAIDASELDDDGNDE